MSRNAYSNEKSRLDGILSNVNSFHLLAQHFFLTQQSPVNRAGDTENRNMKQEMLKKENIYFENGAVMLFILLPFEGFFLFEIYMNQCFSCYHQKDI